MDLTRFIMLSKVTLDGPLDNLREELARPERPRVETSSSISNLWRRGGDGDRVQSNSQCQNNTPINTGHPKLRELLVGDKVMYQEGGTL